MKYETVIGLEVHVQLDTKTKAFCGCSTDFGGQPNTRTCPVCLGFPGSLPVMNKTAFAYAIKVALALNCKVQEYTKFDRKNYFYPDLPKAYQISQYDLPLSRDGFLDIHMDDGPKRIGIRRVHMEEDAGKLIHAEDVSLVDFNRTGIPLLEIVSEPDISSVQEAYEYLVELKSLLEYLDVSDCDMEKGSLRCDANVSLRQEGLKTLGVKVELKNMNSFKGVREALSFEIERQGNLLDVGKPIVQETRLWDTGKLQTFSMRTKEEAQDYRYFPEPDLPPFIISAREIEEAKAAIPELPRQKLVRFMRDYGLTQRDVKILIASREDADYAEECFKAYARPDVKPIANWLIGPLLSEANTRNGGLRVLKVSKDDLLELVSFVEKGQISYLSAKSVLTEMIDTRKAPGAIIKEKNLAQVSDSESLNAIADDVIKENLKSVNDYKQGKAGAIMFLVGQVMKKSQGKANPKAVQEILKRRLSDA
ncbi:MAG: Asp-tRNA(Asn)/Glu-tRNA(Gln) amidotransferase subunit GatB [Candidatus Omnitrophica bacterium]|nr:Asp-tRNA(Asn)/Glu-tRNA(Gln) amidotransferase subunit GatB [Candidatus Omnitrophota bacterium]